MKSIFTMIITLLAASVSYAAGPGSVATLLSEETFLAGNIRASWSRYQSIPLARLPDDLEIIRINKIIHPDLVRHLYYNWKKPIQVNIPINSAPGKTVRQMIEMMEQHPNIDHANPLVDQGQGVTVMFRGTPDELYNFLRANNGQRGTPQAMAVVPVGEPVQMEITNLAEVRAALAAGRSIAKIMRPIWANPLRTDSTATVQSSGLRAGLLGLARSGSGKQ